MIYCSICSTPIILNSLSEIITGQNSWAMPELKIYHWTISPGLMLSSNDFVGGWIGDIQSSISRYNTLHNYFSVLTYGWNSAATWSELAQNHCPRLKSHIPMMSFDKKIFHYRLLCQITYFHILLKILLIFGLEKKIKNHCHFLHDIFKIPYLNE